MTGQNENNDKKKNNENNKTCNMLPPSIVPPPPPTEDTCSLLSPWWSEEAAATTGAEEVVEEKNKLPEKPTHRHNTILFGLSRNMEHNEDKELNWKEKCYLLANIPKMEFEGKMDRERLERLFNHSRECTMVCFLKESRKLAKQRLLLSEEEEKKKTSDVEFKLNPFYGTWISVAKTPKRCREHILGEQALITKKVYPDYYTIDLGKEISHSSEHGEYNQILTTDINNHNSN
ncbi:hypothetical protein G6F57_007105 [Rhizopus arrhizus]|nr:hypothetical protein G6F30_009747 [Rhizopus arrhizus]KAG1420459.1 hypothetical protein G6F58_004183 [Rhizopus delemar]KAG0979727.1 hypothetical protein G6F29_008359 [Rhizopus arrhizus]KAG1034363.1 hypothetical protein G6F25_009715 [Rhizopus arrhizus]KAG1064923.1 hypothetical protein G6F41_009659 [Rhizopus arrhizus]